jgi:hypothetical protein
MPDISLDTDSAAASAARWRDYAEQLERHGQRQQVPAESLPSLLGDVYADYTDAKIAEYEARTAAYGRVAQQARAHAAKLENTRAQFTAADEESGQRFAALGT